MRIIIAVATALLASPSIAQDYRQSALEYARTTLADPYSVRDAEISAPMTKAPNAVVICLRLNARNRMGAYVGLRQYAIPIRDGKLDTSMLKAMAEVGAHASDILCKGATYGPFPELEALGRGHASPQERQAREIRPRGRQGQNR